MGCQPSTKEATTHHTHHSDQEHNMGKKNKERNSRNIPNEEIPDLPMGSVELMTPVKIKTKPKK